MSKSRRYDNSDLQKITDDIAARMAGESERGKVADYIPELANANLNRFGIAIAPLGGETIVAGDADEVFSIQSISKVFSLTLGLQRAGATLWQRVGREPSGDPFNSVVQLEYEKGVPRNPFINHRTSPTGAIKALASGGSKANADIVIGHDTWRFKHGISSQPLVRPVLTLCQSGGFDHGAVAGVVSAGEAIPNCILDRCCISGFAPGFCMACMAY